MGYIPLGGAAKTIEEEADPARRLNMHSFLFPVARATGPGHHRSALASLLLGLAVVACSEENVAPVQDVPAAVEQQPIKWLETSDGISPQQWLVSRRDGAVKPLSDPQVQHIKRLLDDAHKLYRESQRMIANRTVQIEEVLREQGFDDEATVILADLGNLAGEVGQTEGYGAISQHYLNMRKAGRTRDEAISDLKALYGARR